MRQRHTSCLSRTRGEIWTSIQLPVALCLNGKDRGFVRTDRKLITPLVEFLRGTLPKIKQIVFWDADLEAGEPWYEQFKRRVNSSPRLFIIFPESAGLHPLLTWRMRDLIVLLVHLTTVIFRIALPGGVRSVIAESVLMKLASYRESIAPACTQSPGLASRDRRLVFALD